MRFFPTYSKEFLWLGSLIVIVGIAFYQLQSTNRPRSVKAKDIIPILEHPIAPHANYVWFKEGKNHFLRFERNAENNEFKSYHSNLDQAEILSITPDFVVGHSIIRGYSEHVFVLGKLSQLGAIHFDLESSLVLSSEKASIYPSSFDEGVFCCFLEHFTDGVGPHEIVSIQADPINVKLEVKSRLEFDNGVENKFLFQTSKKNTLVLFGTLFHAPHTGILHLVNVTKEGRLVDETIEGFESSLKMRNTEFWLDVSEDGRWIASTEVTSALDQKGDLTFCVMLSEIDNGLIVKQHEKRFSFKPREICDHYYMDIPIRFVSNNSLLVATPIGWGKLDFDKQSVSSDIGKLRLNPNPTNLVSESPSTAVYLRGIVENKGNWFAVRMHQSTPRFGIVVWGKDSIVRLPLMKTK